MRPGCCLCDVHRVVSKVENGDTTQRSYRGRDAILLANISFLRCCNLHKAVDNASAPLVLQMVPALLTAQASCCRSRHRRHSKVRECSFDLRDRRQFGPTSTNTSLWAADADTHVINPTPPTVLTGRQSSPDSRLLHHRAWCLLPRLTRRV